MKKTMKKSASKASHKKTVKDLDVNQAKGGKVRGGAVDSFLYFQNSKTKNLEVKKY